MNKSNHSRRIFIKNTAASTALLAIGIEGLIAFLESCSSGKKIKISSFKTGFKQEPLPYSFDALENVIDTATMEIHYSKHAAAYAKNLNDAANAEKIDTKKSLEDLLPEVSKFSTKFRNNAGGHYNHGTSKSKPLSRISDNIKLVVPLMMPAIHWMRLAVKPSRSALIIGIPPATAASNATITPLADAAAKISVPCTASNALLAVTTCLPAAMASSTSVLAMP